MSVDQSGELNILAQSVGRLLSSGGFELATAESCTGGWIAKCLTDIAGSSAWFSSGYITYSNAAKTRMLDVPQDLFKTDGAVSHAVVEAMAQGALHRSGADIAIAVSGVAGPGGGSDEKPVGTVCFGMVWRSEQLDSTAHVETWRFPGDRKAVRSATVALALERVRIWAESH